VVVLFLAVVVEHDEGPRRPKLGRPLLFVSAVVGVIMIEVDHAIRFFHCYCCWLLMMTKRVVIIIIIIATAIIVMLLSSSQARQRSPMKE
jgi:hypothetical protein